MRIAKKKFSNQSIDADGMKFVDCAFANCSFMYSGGIIPVFERCTLTESCHFEFSDGAANTITLLRDLCKDPFFGPTTRSNLQDFMRAAVRSDSLH